MSKTLPTVAVIGSGTMGAGIAEVAAAAGHPVLIFDIDPEAVVRAIDGIGQRLASRGNPGHRGAGPGGARRARGGTAGGGC
ncbi:3-hydroxyacyl-CoA dehydrogenase NAD-binding domain-containing protein, partial [Klebsiella oxytoca]|uniref:3-hydroxyacyl-CoA dehydrogenase NAD-binding domain-containing protein n=1 Tax=Klebsiella oxytoca TaxID=571 RepID=UPI001D0DC37B